MIEEQRGELGTDILEPFQDSSGLIGSPVGLRERAAIDGFLFFRGLISPERINAVRMEILGECATAGWLCEGLPVEEGHARAGGAWIEGQPEFMSVYNCVQHGELFHALAHDERLLAALEALFGERPLPHARNIARLIFPQNTLHTTPAHQDYIHIQGTEQTYTAWMPLGDCPRELGSLVILRGSHRSGILPVHRARGAGGMGIDTGALPQTWCGGDFAAGDAVLFHSLTVHKALPNLSPDRLRLSVDFRYQPLSHPIDPSSLLPHFAQLSWDSIYAGWREARYQYYWDRMPVTYARPDPRVAAVRSAAADAPPE